MARPKPPLTPKQAQLKRRCALNALWAHVRLVMDQEQLLYQQVLAGLETRHQRMLRRRVARQAAWVRTHQ